MDSFRYINEEQRRRMLDYHRRMSKRVGFDLGETGFYAWVDQYAATFREWADRIYPSAFENDHYTGPQFTDDLV